MKSNLYISLISIFIIMFVSGCMNYQYYENYFHSYIDYKNQEVKTENGSIRFLIATMYDNESLPAYIQELGLEFDTSKNIMEVGVSYKSDSSDVPVKIKAEFEKKDKYYFYSYHPIETGTEYYFGRYYTPLGVMIGSKILDEQKVGLRLKVTVTDAATDSVVSKADATLLLQGRFWAYEIVDLKDVVVY